jgi:hypothetical protein
VARNRYSTLGESPGILVGRSARSGLRGGRAEDTLTAMRFCPKCGQPLEPGASRCLRCDQATAGSGQSATPGSTSSRESNRISSRPPHESVSPGSRKHAGEWHAIRRSGTLAGVSSSANPPPEPISTPSDGRIVPSPVVTVLGVPIPSKASPHAVRLSPMRTVDVGISVPVGSNEHAEPAWASQLRDGVGSNREILGVAGGEQDAARFRELCPDPPKTLPGFARDSVDVQATASAAVEALRAPDSMPFDDSRPEGRAIVKWAERHPSTARLRASKSSRSEPAPIDVPALFYRLDSSIFSIRSGPPSSSQPQSSRPTASISPLRPTQKGSVRRKWVVVLLVASALAAGLFGLLRQLRPAWIGRGRAQASTPYIEWRHSTHNAAQPKSNATQALLVHQDYSIARTGKRRHAGRLGTQRSAS